MTRSVFKKVPWRYGSGAILGGVFFVAWGYFDRPNLSTILAVAVRLLSFCVPALFFTGVAGLYALYRGRWGVVGLTGVVLAFLGAAWGVAGSIANLKPLYAYLAAISGWPRYLFDWLLLLQTGLALTGIDCLVSKPSRRLGSLLIAMGISGWAYSMTDSGVILESRLVHVGFGLLFSLGWVVLGMVFLLSDATET